MRYIRFLKPPKVQAGTINALVTITSDLGESFLHKDVKLAASIRASDRHGDIYLRKALKWKAGMRSLPIMLEIEQCAIGWPARLYVNLHNTNLSDYPEKYHGADLPEIISAWSDVLDPTQGVIEASRSVERRFTSSSHGILSIWEETGESIARHIW